MAGRKKKLTEKKIDLILEAFSDGLTIRDKKYTHKKQMLHIRVIKIPQLRMFLSYLASFPIIITYRNITIDSPELSF
jgi:hypothetical protein